MPRLRFTYTGAGAVKADTRNGVTTTYSYYHSGRLSAVSPGSSSRGPYHYDALGRLVSRQVTGGVPASTVHMIHDEEGNLLAEASSAGATMREYVWLEGRPVAVFDDVDTGNPVALHVHADHLDRPVLMTNAAGSAVWNATCLPFGEVFSVTGPASLDYRFPGQWFMAETGLHYNWHRWYDASTGRYTQPDPLGLDALLSDGPSRYAYALNSPLMYTDPTGEMAGIGPGSNRALGNLWDWVNPFRPGDGGSCPTPEDNNQDCFARYNREADRCSERYFEYPHRDFYRACLARAAERRNACVRNGFQPSPDEPPEWSEADEEVWRNFGR